MQFVGVIREHEDGLYKIGQPLCEFIEAKYTYDDLPGITQYLETGAILIAFLHYVTDNSNGEPLVPLIFYTDGKWIWPSYFSFYLQRYNFKIQEDFLADIRKNNYKVPAITKEQLLDAEKFYTKNYNPKLYERKYKK